MTPERTDRPLVDWYTQTPSGTFDLFDWLGTLGEQIHGLSVVFLSLFWPVVILGAVLEVGIRIYSWRKVRESPEQADDDFAKPSSYGEVEDDEAPYPTPVPKCSLCDDPLEDEDGFHELCDTDAMTALVDQIERRRANMSGAELRRELVVSVLHTFGTTGEQRTAFWRILSVQSDDARTELLDAAFSSEHNSEVVFAARALVSDRDDLVRAALLAIDMCDDAEALERLESKRVR